MIQVNKKTKKCILLSIIISVILLFACYFFDNIAYPFKIDAKKYSLFEYFRGKWPNDNNDTEGAVFVNVSYDRMFIMDTADVPDTNRKSVITDRRQLVEFLKRVEKLNYRYLFIDLRFEASDRSEYDSALVEQLMKMRDVAIAKHWDIENERPYAMIDNRLETIGRYCDFDESKSSAGFFKYQYLQNGENSIALEMYRKATGRTIKKHGPFFFDGGNPCRNAQFIVIHTSMAKEWQEENHKFNYHHMGVELLSDTNCWNNFRDDVSGNYLIIGNMKEDMHDTYVGKQPGAYLHWLGFKSLLNRRHYIHWWNLIIIVLLLSVISFIILQGLYSNVEHTKIILWIHRHPLVHFFCSLFKYSALLFIASAISYLLFDIAFSVFIPSTCFAILSNFVQFKKMQKEQ